MVLRIMIMRKKFIFIIILFFLILFFKKNDEEKFHRQNMNNNNNKMCGPLFFFTFKNKKIYNKIKKYNFKHDIFEIHNQELKKYKPNFILNKNEIFSNKSKHVNIWFIDNKKQIKIQMNHYYIGPDSFLKIKSRLLNQIPISMSNINYNSIFLLKNFVKDYYTFLNSENFSPLLKNELCYRYYETKKFQLVNNQQIVTLYYILCQVYKCLNLKRPMRILITEPFYRINKTNNNIGIIFILFNNDTFEEFSKYFQEKKYMANISNLLLVTKINSLFGNSTNIRNKIDVVLSSSYSNIKDDIYKNMNYSLFWTTSINPIEPIYISMYSRINNNYIICNINYTIHTYFKKSKNMKRYNIDI